MKDLLRRLCLFVFLPFSLSAQNVDEQHYFFASSISWHTGIVIPASAFPEELWTNTFDYSDALYLEIGWGEADYYPHEGFNVWYALKSVFWPTASVVHINPISRPVVEYYYDTDVVRLEVTEEEFQELLNFLTNSLELDDNGKIIPAAKGKYPDSHFFKSHEKYYFPKNSNVWAARALKEAGFSLHPMWYQTTGQVLNKAANF